MFSSRQHVSTPQYKLMHSQHFLAAEEHVYFRKTPEFVVFRFGLSQGLRQRRQPGSPGNEDGARRNDKKKNLAIP